MNSRSKPSIRSYLASLHSLSQLTAMPSMDQNHEDQIGLERTHVYNCRICNKGFPSGRALGGHMGAHSVAPAAADDDEEEDESVTQSNPDADGASPVRGSKRDRGCENCGKEFPCWKSFLEHGKCGSGAEGGSDEDVESFPSSPPRSRARDVADAVAAGWHKGKRSRRAKTGGASEEEDLARSLMMLSAARIEAASSEADEHSCASEAADAPKGRVFACATCNKEFASHQALGGHRASHKKVKGCFAGRAAPLDGAPLEPEEAARLEQIAGELAAAGASSAAAIVPIECPAPLDARKPEKKSRMHECSVCHREFTSGQALGGHKRSHWHTEKLPEHGVELPPLPSAANLHPPAIPVTPGPLHAPKSLPLDLNLPASIPAGELAGVMREIGSSSLPLEASIAMYLKGLIDPGRINWKRGGDDGNKKKKSKETEIINVDDEEETRVTLAKLSEDIKNTEGGSSAWLQVGIGSSCKAEERKSKPTRRSGRDDEQNL